jgi:hypothetical protein
LTQQKYRDCGNNDGIITSGEKTLKTFNLLGGEEKIMSEYHYLLLGGSRHGQKHIDENQQFSLFFRGDNSGKRAQNDADFYRGHNESYKVSPEKCADGHWYLVGYCDSCPKIPIDELTNLLIDQHIKPMM